MTVRSNGFLKAVRRRKVENMLTLSFGSGNATDTEGRLKKHPAWAGRVNIPRPYRGALRAIVRSDRRHHHLRKDAVPGPCHVPWYTRAFPSTCRLDVPHMLQESIVYLQVLQY
jgi:hypothetical protein